MQAQFNPLPLLSVKSGLDSSLANISRELENFFSSSGADQQALRHAREELHRIGGVLRMLSLTGLVVFCGELEKLMLELEQAQEVGASQRDAIRRALFGLTHYLDALADGASNATLRLFHEYQELLQARGMEMAFDVDLFFPSLQVELPEALLRQPQQQDAPARIKAARSQYQQALLKWLRQDDKAEALHVMTAAVNSVVTCVPQNQQRAFWWVASGLLDCLAYEGIPPELNVKKSLSRIDLKMKSLTDGSPFDEEVSISETLYLIARSHSVSDTVDEIKRVYALDVYLPEEQPMPPSETAALLENMRAELQVAQESWELCVTETAGACQKFAADMERVHALSEQLDRNTLQFLSKLIHTTAVQLEDAERAQRITMDMAMALLLLDGGIEHYQHLGSGFQEQARILSTRLQAAMMRMPEDENKLSSLISLYCQMEQQEVMVPLATEMQGNLQHIEQSLNAFFNNAAKRDELSQIGLLLSQVQGGLHILSLDVAVKLVGLLRQATERYVQGAIPPASEMRTVAAAVSALEEYVHGLVLGQRSDAAALNGVLQELTEMRAEPGYEEAPAKEEAVPAGVSIRTGGEDEELLEVFLEEAREVMETLRSNLEISRLHMDSREPLVTMRRGFHTLKGSGRMVGLTELGEVAWAVERAMNKWLQENKPATPVLLDMIGDAEVLFQHWVDMLSSGSTNATIDTSYLLLVADCIENGKEVPQTRTEPAMQEAVIETQQPEEAESEEERPVEIGSVSLSPALFNIATEEAAGHVHALHEQLAVLHETESHIVTYDFMRAAHTLAGVNRTMGLVQIAELAYALELWLEERIDKPYVVNEQQIALIDQVVQRLEEMCAVVRDQRQEPQPQPELIALLQEDKAIVATEAAPPELEAVPALEFEAPLALPEPEEVIEPVLPEAALDFAIPEEAVPEAAEAPQTLELPVPAAEPESVTAEGISETGLEIPSIPGLPEVAEARGPEAAQESPVATTDEEEPVLPLPQREREVHDEVDEQLLPIFLEEAHELYPQIGRTLRAWREQPGDVQSGRNLQRSLHTLKGSARMAGAMRLGELTHRVEDRVDKAIASGELNAELWNELDNYLDRIGNAIEQLQQPQQPQAAPEQPVVASEVQQQHPEAARTAPVQALEVGAERAMQAALLRVRSDTVDRLVNEAGEVSVARSRAEMELSALKNSVLDLTDSVNRLRKQLREIEIQAEGQMQARISVSGESAEKFDPLEFDRFTRFQEVTRFMNESVHDVQTVQQALLKNLAETEAALTAQAHLNRDLQQGLMAIRMVPFASISERLYRIVRQTGKELGKRANLELSGTEVELDRSVLEKMTAPFEHLLRNAVAHGLETPEQRELAGKEAIGEIRLSLRQESNEVVFEFSDDGAGLDLARVRQKAVETGVVHEGEEISDESAMQLIFTPGLSTAQEVTEISGRGVGLDVVRSEITALGGRIDVASELGHGLRFTIHLPLTLAVTKTLLVRAGSQTYALPSTMIENVQQLKPAALDAVYSQQYVDWQGSRYPLYSLARMLGDDEAEIENQPHNPVLLLRAGDKRVALHVDELLGNQEVVVKNIGPQLARLPGIAGATVSANGTVILILNPIAFTQRIVVTRKIAKAAAEAVHKAPVVMVVDDSLTVRKITSRLLARSGYQVVTAKDGVDALEQLVDVLPDVMLLDVEMPRMDGFELTKRLRQDARTQDLPIIMITSRTADKHRRYALELGVNEYMGKPYQEEELLDNISRFVKT
ncbi:Hpt domain-containing protein [Sideroxydans lithotrophicus]|uniref:Chemotaxis protein CheA n=1 Tax=Sideroxydans lithotrophicus (strain ES-1) TaxID=580332 RepID=D5CQE0_SIDLE|nr:Hpt domain-containing protein [Sideroxydans lithotrophicus]ADE13161.1 CheA signal transduction histidine kinase [Sideroxydans lithotrophicus ES-1]